MQWYESDDLQVGDWVQFESRMNFAVLDDRALSIKPRGRSPRGPLLFWEPQGLVKNGGAETILLLHGSPDGLVGGTTNVGQPDLVEEILGSDSAAPWVIRTLRQLRHSDEPLSLNDVDGQNLLGWVVQMLDQEYPAFTASWLAGYARVTGLPDYSYTGSRFILATPLYVERVPPPEEA